MAEAIFKACSIDAIVRPRDLAKGDSKEVTGLYPKFDCLKMLLDVG